MSDEQHKVISERAHHTVGSRTPVDTRTICQSHWDRWWKRWRPTQCAACLKPLAASGSMLCPEWMRQQLGAQHGASVHDRPCYRQAVAAKKPQSANTQPMEVTQEIAIRQPTFQLNVSDTRHSRFVLSHSYHAHTHSCPVLAGENGGASTQLPAECSSTNQRPEKKGGCSGCCSDSSADLAWRTSCIRADTRACFY